MLMSVMGVLWAGGAPETWECGALVPTAELIDDLARGVLEVEAALDGRAPRQGGLGGLAGEALDALALLGEDWGGERGAGALLGAPAWAPALGALLAAVDPALLALEALGAGALAWGGARVGGALRARWRHAFDDLAAFCQGGALSLTEVGALALLAPALLALDFFLAFAEDDPTEAFGGLVLALAVVGGGGLALALDAQYLYLVGPLGGGGAPLVTLNDLVANALCVLRIVLCWVRYLFYDFQVEALDWAFHYVEGAGEGAPAPWGGAWAPLLGALWALADAWALALQALAALAKYAIALFLAWLLFDLFWFRPLGGGEAGAPRRGV